MLSTQRSRGAELLASWVYPTKCCLCDMLDDSHLCSICRDAFEPRAQRVARAYGPADLSYWAAIFAYDGRAAQAVQRLKYNRATALAGPLSNLLFEAAEAEALLDVDLIVPVPIHWSRRCLRGFNQSDLLAEAFPKNLLARWPVRRIRATRPQVGLSHDERTSNLKGAFRASPKVAGKRVLLIDDVLTSGQTARECASALKAAGATEVGALALCGGGI